MSRNNDVISSLLPIIENSSDKWICVPSEYENLKEYYAKHNDNSLNGYDDWFNIHFIILTQEEINLRKERIQNRDKALQEIQELNKELEEIEKRKSKISFRLSVLKDYSDNLSELINLGVEE